MLAKTVMGLIRAGGDGLPVANCQLIARLCFAISTSEAGVVELVDALDSKTFENQKILANTPVLSHIFRQMT